MLNLHPNVICPSEEPFAVFFYERYKNKTQWTDAELLKFIDEFWLIAEKDLNLFFTSKQNLFNELVKHKDALNYRLLCDLVYLQFFEPKPKNDIHTILDKQIKYFFYLKTLVKLYPDSKYIILTRDPRVNAARKKSRKLNAGQNPLYLAALWNNTYRNILYLEKKNKAVLIVKYEDLVLAPEKVLENVCSFIQVPYMDSLIKTEGAYETFLNIQKEKVDKDHINYLTNFQSSLFGKIDKEKIHLKEDEINPELNDKIVKLSKPLLEKLGYDIQPMHSAQSIRFSLQDRYHILIAYLYRPLLIVFYKNIPLWLKLVIKRLRS